MTRDEIYEHLAQVYLGKKNKTQEKKKKQFNAWLVINIVITLVIFVSSFYGLSAFLTHRKDNLQNKIIYALNNGPIRVTYNLTSPYPQVKTFSLLVPPIHAAKYENLEFAVRGTEEGHPGIVRVELKNQRNEVSSLLVQGIQQDWRNFIIPFSEFRQISDWSSITEVSFILEAWNAERAKGVMLIDSVCFSSQKGG